MPNFGLKNGNNYTKVFIEKFGENKTIIVSADIENQINHFSIEEKANYMKMSDEQMLKEMMKDSDKYFYEIPSSVKSLEQTRLEIPSE